MAHPDGVTANISQNGNAYEEGLGSVWEPIQQYWREPTAQHREVVQQAFNPAGIRFQYTAGVPNRERIAPQGYTLDTAMITRPGKMGIQLDPFLD